jgi:putative ABC transport system substrate-binding protein
VVGISRAVDDIGLGAGSQHRDRVSLEGDASRAQVLTQEFLTLRPDVLVAHSTPSLIAIRKATRTIPVVFIVADPVSQGFVPSLARPART